MSTQERYLVLARKYRPKNFNHLYYGQDPLAKTISHAIRNNSLAQGYLFTGIRGIGKTSSARIMAKTANCTKPELDEEHGYIKACEQCENCSSFNQAAHPDIIEIDAASHTGVDDVRELINSAEYKPMLARYKFYIIDEVHMLSKSAFNALLKLLEEPPSHAIFILATTEVNKIPLTVISRCQRFDLKRMSVQTLLSLTQEICQKENIKYQDEALELLCSKADGSARDALSLLDQAHALAQTQNTMVDTDIIRQLANSTDTEIILKYLGTLEQNDAKAALDIVNQINDIAPGINYFFEDILSAIAYLSKSKLVNDYHDPAWGVNNTQLRALASKFSLSRLTILWQILSKAHVEFKTTHNILLCAEMLTIRLIYATMMPELSTTLPTAQASHTRVDDHASAIVQQTTQTPAPNNISLAEFLTYLKDHRHFDIVYSLMNETSVIKFQEGELILQQTTPQTSLKKQVEELLRTWSGTDWKLSINGGELNQTLKEQLTVKAKNSELWKNILSNFEHAIVTDIKP